MSSIPMIALTTIERCVKPGKAATKDSPAVPPKTESIPTGKPFEARDREEADELLALKAASEVGTPAKKAAAEKVAAAKKPQANQSSKQTPPALEGEARDAKIKEIMSTLTEDGMTSDGKPNVPAVNEHLPAGTKGITAKERDALWAEVSKDADAGNGTSEDLV